MFFFFPPETPDHPSLFSRTVIGRGTFPALAPVLGPEQKKLVMPPSSTVHGGQYDTKHAKLGVTPSFPPMAIQQLQRPPCS